MRTAPPPADVREEAARLSRALGRLRRAVNPRVRARLQGAPLPEAQVDVLRAVAHGDEPRIQEVAANLRLAPNTVSTLVRALAERGLVERRADPQDRRAVRLALTPLARRRIAAARSHRVEILASHMARLDADDRDALHAALPPLERLVESLEMHDH